MASVEAIESPEVSGGVASALREGDASPLVTADEFAEMPLRGPHELISGRGVEVSRPGDLHAVVCLAIGMFLRQWTRKNGLRAYDDVGVIVSTDPDTVRGPDLAVGPRRPLDGRALREPPSSVIEVLSPSNTRTEIHQKVAQFFAAGVREAWVFDPQTRTAEAYRPDAPTRVVPTGGRFESDELPGFSVTLSECFEDLDDVPAPAEDA